MASIFISDLWNKWNIRGVVILSLIFQVFLILSAPLRKKIANKYIWLLWLVYLMADSIVVYGIGLISHNQGNTSARGAEVNGAVQSFWATFLLLHLGGPDTITAFSLEDSLLWKRHLLSLISQAIAAIYVFVQIFPTDESLVIPTMLVFSLGVIKNAERILALHLSSLPRMRESMDPSDSQYRSVDLLSRAVFRYARSIFDEEEEAQLAESIVVKHAYSFFQNFKVFLVDLIVTNEQLRVSCDYFHKVLPLDALRVISVELQFMYEMLHTKALAIRSKWSYVFRSIALIVLAVAFILFNRLKKHRLSGVDINITYFLLCGGIALDVMTLFMLIFSDWTIGVIKCRITASSRLNRFIDKVVSATDYLRKPRFATYDAKFNAGHIYLDTPIIFRRWSESIFACNLFSEIMKESPRKMKKCKQGWIGIAFSNISSLLFRMAEKITPSFCQTCVAVVEGCLPRKTSMIAHAKYVSKNPFNNRLWIFIFEELKRKSDKIASGAMLVRSIFEARGDLFLTISMLEKLQEERVDLQPYITDCNYDFSILYWHIATEWCYRREKSTGRNELREFSKILSDYMLYLLLNQPNLMFAVAGNGHFTSGEILKDLRDAIPKGTVDVEKRLMSLPEEFLPFNARRGLALVKEMERLGEEKWEVMSGVWVEMLCYAAGHIRGESHAQVLSKGGELLAFVWLLMAHFGFLIKKPWGWYYE